MIEQTLTKLDFNTKEITIFLEILRRGKVTPASLSKATGINRGTVYSVAKTLLEKGVITEDLGGKSTYFVALPPEDLKVLIEKEEKELKKKKRLVWQAIDELAELPLNTQYAVPKIRFIEDENVGDFLYKQSSIWSESIMKKDPSKTWWGFQDHTLAEYFEEWIDWFWTQAPEELEINLLSNESDIEEKMKAKPLSRRHIAFWKESMDFTANTWIVGEYIVMIYTRERPFYLIEIHNAVLAHNMREIFKTIWKDVKKNP